MKKSRSRCDGFRFCAARWHHRVDLSRECGEASAHGRSDGVTMAALAAASGLPRAPRTFVKAAVRVSNRAKCRSRSACRSKRQIQQGNVLRIVRSSRDPRRARAYVSRSGLIVQHIAMNRHHMMATGHRLAPNVRLFARDDWTDGRFSQASRLETAASMATALHPRYLTEPIQRFCYSGAFDGDAQVPGDMASLMSAVAWTDIRVLA